MPSRIVCFVCGSLGGEYPLHSRARESGAYFPFLEHHEPPKGSRIPGPDGVVDSCRVCYAFLTQQWETYERSNTPAIKRLYWLKRLDDGQFTGAEMKLQGEYMAQVMGLQYQPACGDNCAPLSPDESTSYSREGFGTSSSSGRERKQQDFGGEGVLDLSVPVKLEPVPKKADERSHHSSEEKTGDISSSSHYKPDIDELGFVCFTCGAESQGVVAKFIPSVKHQDHEHFYPFLTKLSPPKGALPLDSRGMCQVCDHCFSSLQHQWLSYEHHGTPNSARIFKVNGFFFSNDSSISMATSDDMQDNCIEVCYLCSESYPPMKLCPLFTSSSGGQEDQMYFPFIRELRRPHGARPLNPDGSVHVCVNCYRYLQSQWQHYEVEKVPILMRRYSLLPSASSTSQTHLNRKPDPLPTVFPTETFIKSPVQPLNIEISKTSETSVKNVSYTPQFTVSTNSSLVTPLSTSDLSRQQSANDGKANPVQTIPHPLLQAGERPKKVCFVCGEKCLVTKMQILYSYPAKHEVKIPGGQPQSVPFFPFLANREPALHAEPMTEEGTVTACSYCFYSLLNQWRDFEESKNVADKNCWLRKYVTNEFVCFVCSLSVKRKKMRTLEVQKFQFLRDHKAPHGALVMWGGEAVGACGYCHFSLTHQYAEYERLGVPLEMRKYNWTIQNATHVSENSCDGPESGQGQPWSGNEDSNLSMDDAPGPPSVHASKPPFSMMSPGAVAAASSAAKLPLKTATVPPLNQVSPSNGLPPSNRAACVSGSQTSSFAAALRKLANQAKDPAEDVSVKSNHSPPAAHSPRATTPKRSSHPLTFPPHSLPSTLSTPPVVTIAPTPAHHHSQSRVHSRQTLDLLSSTHGLPFDMNNSKSDRGEGQTHSSSHQREEDRSLRRESPLSRTPSRLYPQVSSASNGLSLQSQALDMYGVGYNPYRLEEEAAAHHGLSVPYGIDPAAYAAAAAAAAAYHPALLQQHPAFLPSPFRLDDPILLERYRLLQSPYFPFSMGAGLLPSHPAAGSLGVHSLLAASAAAAGQRYPAELLQQHHPYLSPNHPLLDPRFAAQAALLERSRLEEDKAREKEREKGREQEHEKRDHESDHSRGIYHHSSEGKEAPSYSQSERSKADLLNIPSRAVHPLERDRGSHRYRHDEQDPRNSRSRSPTSRHHNTYNAQKHRSDHPSTTSPSVTIDASGSHSNHTQGKPSHSALFSHDKTAATIISHQHGIHGLPHQHRVHGLHRNSDHPVKPESSRDHPQSQDPIYNRLKYSSDAVSPSKLSNNRLSHNHVEKKAKHPELSRIFRPFDEPKACPSEKEEAQKNCHSDPVPCHLPPSSRPLGRSALDTNSHFPLASSSLHDTKTSDILSIPVLRVPPQSHSIPSSQSLFSRSTEETKTISSSPPSQSAKPISHCISDRIERFDFKSLARECTSSSSPAVGSECSAELHQSSLTSSFLEENRPRECMSKLDLEEKRQRETCGSENGFGCCDVVDEEERMMAHLTMVGRVTPLPLDASEDKVAMLEAVELTTRRKKKELLLKREVRRRRHQRQASISPILHVVDQTEEFQSQGNRSRDQLYQRLLLDYKLVNPNRLNKEPDFEEKVTFLTTLRLRPSTRSHRTACDNFLKRKYDEMMNPGSSSNSAALRSETPTPATPATLPSLPAFGHSKGQLASPPPLLPIPSHSDRDSRVDESVPKPSVIFSNVDSWLHGSKEIADKYQELSHQSLSSASEFPRKNGGTVPASLSFPFREMSRLESSDSSAPITIPSLPVQWNVTKGHMSNKTESPVFWPGMEALPTSNSYFPSRNCHPSDRTSNKGEESSLPPGGRNLPEKRQDLNHSASIFSHPIPAVSLEDKHRMEGEQGSSYDLSLQNLKRGLQNFR